ncbi:MAG: UDP-glucose 4-epimerase GalE, partial [Clostridia bacterium]
DNFVNSNIGSVKAVEKITGKKVKFVEGDVCDKALLNKVFDENDIYAVIHFAGLKAVGESCVLPLKYYQNNLISTLSLVEVMAKHNVKKLIFSSSATVYGTPEALPLNEKSKIGGTTNPYGTTKLMIEQILSDIFAADKTWNIALLRYFNPVGAHKSGLIGEDPKGIPNNLMPYVAKVAFGELPFVRVFGDDYDTPDGTGVRDYIHVMDLAEGHLAALNNIDKFGVTPCNLGTGVGYSVLDMIKAFEKACGKEIPFKIIERRPGDIAACYASPDFAKEFIGWSAKRNLEDMCLDTWNFQNNKK